MKQSFLIVATIGIITLLSDHVSARHSIEAARISGKDALCVLDLCSLACWLPICAFPSFIEEDQITVRSKGQQNVRKAKGEKSPPKNDQLSTEEVEPVPITINEALLRPEPVDSSSNKKKGGKN